MEKPKHSTRRWHIAIIISAILLLLFGTLWMLGSINFMPPGIPNTIPHAAAPFGNRLSCDDVNVLAEHLTKGGTWVFDCVGVHALPHEIVIENDTTLLGSVAGETKLDGQGTLDMMFFVKDGAVLTLKHIQVVRPARIGVYVAAGGALYADNCRFAYLQNNALYEDSAGIFNNGVVNLQDCIVEQHALAGNNAAIRTEATAITTLYNVIVRDNSLGIYSIGQLILHRSLVAQNDRNCIISNAIVDPDAVCAPYG